MGRPKKVDPPTATLEIRASKSDETPDENADESEIRDIVAEFPQETVAKVSRIPATGLPEWVETMSPGEVSEERIARHGPGKYRVKFWGPNAKNSGKVGYLGLATFTVGASAAAQAVERVRQEAVSTVPQAGPSIVDMAMVTMFKQMQDMSAQAARNAEQHSTAMVMLMRQMAERPAVDPLMALVLPKLLESNNNDPLAMAERVKQLLGTGGSKSSVSEILSVMELIDKVKESSGGDKSGGGANWMDLVRDGLRLLGTQQPATPNDPNAGALHRQPVIASPTVGVPTVSPSRPVVDDYLAPFAPFFPQIAAAANAGTEPDLAADFFLSLIPAGHWPGLGGILARETVVSDIVKGYPPLGAFQPWLEGLRASMLSGIQGDGDGDDDGEGEKPPNK